MKKVFKKLMTVALVVALSNVVVGVEKAEAAGHVHEEETIILTAREGGYEHYVKLYDWQYDEYGNEVYVQTGKLRCTVTVKEYSYVKRCIYCYKNLYYDWYLGPEMHSYSGCPVG